MLMTVIQRRICPRIPSREWSGGILHSVSTRENGIQGVHFGLISPMIKRKLNTWSTFNEDLSNELNVAMF